MHQYALVDDISTAAKGVHRGGRSLAFLGFIDLHNPEPIRAKPPQHRLLMSLAPGNQCLESQIEPTRRPQKPSGTQQIKPGQVAAREEVSQVAGREPKPVPNDLHSPLPVAAGPQRPFIMSSIPFSS